jgi:predicted anti-sigma-YlaC factor YlaD
MLVHGDLKGWPRLRMEAHLVSCSECRARRKRMGSLSVSLAHVFQNPSLGYRTFRAAPRLVWAGMAATAFFVGGASVLTVNAIHGAGSGTVAPAGEGASLRSCDLMPNEKATALANKKKLDHPKRKHDNPDK